MGGLSWLSAVSAFSLSAFQLLPKCGLGWLRPAFRGSKFKVRVPIAKLPQRGAEDTEGVRGLPCCAASVSFRGYLRLRHGVCHKHPEYIPPLPPRRRRSGGSLAPPWTYSGTIGLPQNPLSKQASLSKSISGGSSAVQP